MRGWILSPTASVQSLPAKVVVCRFFPDTTSRGTCFTLEGGWPFVLSGKFRRVCLEGSLLCNSRFEPPRAGNPANSLPLPVLQPLDEGLLWHDSQFCIENAAKTKSMEGR